jgi:hypothetical protein
VKRGGSGEMASSTQPQDARQRADEVMAFSYKPAAVAAAAFPGPGRASA